MTLVVHIGYHKTGSTAIQSFVANNRTLLSEAGLISPTGLSNWLGHPEIAWANAEANEHWQDRSYSIAEIADHYGPTLESSRSTENTVLLTSEEFCRYDLTDEKMESLAKFLLPYDPIIFGYTRNPLDFLLSRYRHEVQAGGEHRPLSSFLGDPSSLCSASFGTRTSMWEKYFHGRCVWRSYDKVMKQNPNVVAHFLSLLDIDIAHFEFEREDGELKIHPSLIPALRLISASGLPYDERVEAFQLLIETGDRLPRANLRDVFGDLGASPDLLHQIAVIADAKINTTRTFADFGKVRKKKSEAAAE
jgi:hypothetical protein